MAVTRHFIAAGYGGGDAPGGSGGCNDEGVGTKQLGEVLGLLAGAYRWARNQNWTTVDPTADVELRDIIP